MAIIYKIQNKQNGKVYIGQTRMSFETRLYNKFCGHFENAFIKNYDTALCNALRKYGKEGFTYEVIEERSSNSFKDKNEMQSWLDIREKYWISYYDSTNINKGYNRTIGGSTKNYFTEETKLKISINTKKAMANKEIRQKLSEAKKGKSPANKGRRASEQLKHKISEATKKAFQRKEVAANHKNAINNPETQRKMRETKLKNGTNRHSKEHCKNISIGKTGTKWLNNGIISKQIKTKDIEKFLQEGWTFGRL